MKKLLIASATTAFTVGIAIGTAGTASAGGPCDTGTGVGYAQGHIVELAQAGALGNGGHKPGSHAGFSVCNPSGK